MNVNNDDLTLCLDRS